MTQSSEDCDWLVVQEGNKRGLLGSIISLHFEITCVIFPVLPYSLSHRHTHYICIYNFLLFTMLSYLIVLGNEQRHYKCCNRPKSSLLHSCIFPVAIYVNVEITSISGAIAFLHGVWDVSVSLIRSVTNMILAQSNVHLINSLSCNFSSFSCFVHFLHC